MSTQIKLKIVKLCLPINDTKATCVECITSGCSFMGLKSIEIASFGTSNDTL